MRKTFKVKGMHCNSCNWLISENVKEIKGVRSVEADFTKRETVVEFEKPATEEEIIKAIEKEGGYKVENIS
ncbi:MAG TPA: cation transporter [Candidatus Norongarragalinales archaeon]|nr:cation transporter [Candidatus Norongarragalinales archaeon]